MTHEHDDIEHDEPEVPVSNLAERCAAKGWELTTHASGRVSLRKDMQSLHFQDRNSLLTWLGKAGGNAAPMVGLPALIERLASVGLRGRFRPTRGSLIVCDADGSTLFETRSAARVENLLAKREGGSV